MKHDKKNFLCFVVQQLLSSDTVSDTNNIDMIIKVQHNYNYYFIL